MKTLEVRPEIDPKEVARRLVSICGGNKKEAISTLAEGGKRLSDSSFGNLLFNVSQEIASVRPEGQDAYRFVHRGQTRKGGGPGIKRYL